jgi:hypothetical protein
MRRTVIHAAAVILGIAQQSPTLAQPSTFRARVDVVSVEVFVYKGKSPVTGLTTNAFELFDNGVRQSIDAVDSQSSPLDVTALLDVSGSTADVARSFREGATRVARMLRADDRVRFVAFAEEVEELSPMQGARPGPVREIRVRGSSSIYDALLYGFAWSAPPERRHLIVLFSDGYENSSLLDAEAILRVAQRSDAVLYLVLPSRTIPRMVDAFFPVAAERRRLMEIASETGGGPVFMQEDARLGRDIEAHVDREARSAAAIETAFRRVLTHYRSSYLLRYRATGVPLDGWHDIKVQVAGKDAEKYTVHARKGYAGR